MSHCPLTCPCSVCSKHLESLEFATGRGHSSARARIFQCAAPAVEFLKQLLTLDDGFGCPIEALSILNGRFR